MKKEDELRLKQIKEVLSKRKTGEDNYVIIQLKITLNYLIIKNFNLGVFLNK